MNGLSSSMVDNYSNLNGSGKNRFLSGDHAGREAMIRRQLHAIGEYAGMTV